MLLLTVPTGNDTWQPVEINNNNTTHNKQSANVIITVPIPNIINI